MSDIADRLDRDASTIYREIKRNSVRLDDQPELNGYHALAAQDRYEKRRAIHRKLIIYPDIMAAVRSGFDAGWSPEQIAGRMRLERHPMRVSHALSGRVLRSNVPRRRRYIDMPIRRMADLRSSTRTFLGTVSAADRVAPANNMEVSSLMN